MKNKMRIWQFFAAVAIFATAAACSDGQWDLGKQPSVEAPTPTIVVFEAKPAEIAPGEKVTLSWEVTNADNIEISTIKKESKFQFHTATKEVKSSTVVEGITETTTFRLTATLSSGEEAKEGENKEGEKKEGAKAIDVAKGDENPAAPPPAEPTPSVASKPLVATKDVQVVVKAVVQPTATITADKETLSAGESTIIRWEVTPADSQVAVTASDETPVVAAKECETVTGTVEGYPTSGCAVVTPAATTTYTVSGKTTDNKDISPVSVTVNVARIELTANISLDKETANFGDMVQVSWNVTPEDAAISITASPSVECAEPGLSEVEGANGIISCTITETTTFTLTAEMEGADPVTDSATVTVQAVGGSVTLEYKADPWAFVSEEVDVTITVPEAARAIVESIQVGGKTITDISGTIEQRVKVPDLAGIPVLVKKRGLEEPERASVPQSIIPFGSNQFFAEGGAPLQVTRVFVDPKVDPQSFYFGTQRDDFGKISVFRLNDFKDSKEFLIELEEPLKNAYGLQGVWHNNNFFAKIIKNYPVNVIAFRENKPDWILVGTTGAILYSNDAGGTWNVLDVIYYNKDNGTIKYTGEHPTCAGKTQTGCKESDDCPDIIYGMGQACDMIVREDGRIIMAYDRGVETLDNVEARISDPDKNKWQGKPEKDGESSSIYGFVAHDLEEVKDQIYAATDKGVYVNQSGDGTSWAPFVGGDLDAQKAVYTLAFDQKSGQLFAGAIDGVYVTAIDSASWAKTEGELKGPVLSLAVDPAYNEKLTGPVVLAGTANGVAVTRNGGKFWSVLDSDASKGLGEVRSVAITAIVPAMADMKSPVATYKVAAGGQGYAAGTVDIGGQMVVQTAELKPEEKETEEEGEGEGQGGGGSTEKSKKTVIKNMRPLIMKQPAMIK